MSTAVPRTVSTAVLLIAAAYLTGIVKWAWLNDWAHPVFDGLQLTVGTLALGWALSRLRRGERLWRWVFVLFFVWGIVDLSLWPPAVNTPWELAIAYGQIVLQCIGTALLFLAEPHRYFLAR